MYTLKNLARKGLRSQRLFAAVGIDTEFQVTSMTENEKSVSVLSM